MRRWRAYRSPAIWGGLLVLLALVLLAAAAGMQLGRSLAGGPGSWQLNLDTFWLVVALVGSATLAGVLLYRLGSAWSMRYALDRNAVFITWLGNRYVIPMDRIESADLGVQNARLSWFGVRPFGYRRGLGWLADGRPLQLFATAPLRRCLVIYTSDAAYAISPEAERDFIQELEQHRHIGVVQPLAEGVERSTRLSYHFWLDPSVLRLILVVLMVNLAMWAALSIRYEQLPDLLLLRLDPSGGHLQPKYRLLLLPLGAAGVAALNLLMGLRLYRRDRAAALLLQVGSVLVHVLALVALLNLVR